MKQVNYIIVNETDAKTAARIINGSHLPDIGHHVVVDGSGITNPFNPVRCETLVKELCRLRKHHPEAKILGISELGDYCVHPSEAMNQLRRKLSKVPQK